MQIFGVVQVAVPPLWSGRVVIASVTVPSVLQISHLSVSSPSSSQVASFVSCHSL